MNARIVDALRPVLASIGLGNHIRLRVVALR